MKLTFAVCTYNRSQRLPPLLERMRAQQCSVPFEVLVVDNNSTDDTRAVVARVAATPGTPVRYVREGQQGIPHARNRALAEAMGSDFLVFIDDDELPHPGLLEAAVQALTREGARCVGGKVKVRIPDGLRPKWLADNLLGFLAEVDYGHKAFWIKDSSTPVWTANIAYDMRLFRDDPQLRFDPRFNRRGHGVGGGSDAVMFQALLERGTPIRYCPDMVVDHYVETWRLHRRYFLKLHFTSGRKYGQFQMGEYPRTVFGIPPFLIVQALRQWLKTVLKLIRREPDVLRQAMNGTYALGLIWGRILRQLERGSSEATPSGLKEARYR
ncbi:glycosyltransferase [Candidatus Methylocalor cossyra]